MNTKLYGVRVQQGEDGSEVKLHYYLTEDAIEENYCDLKRYGIIVKKTGCSASGGKINESKELKDVFFDKTDAEIFMRKIINGGVTPITLKDIIEDYIAYDYRRYRAS